MKSCLDGYLTDGCKNCPDWADGTDDRGLGCACNFPIGACPHFRKMMEEEEQKLRHCNNCNNYGLKEPKRCNCTGQFTPRKAICDMFVPK